MTDVERQTLKELDEITPAKLTHRIRNGNVTQHRRRRPGTPEYAALSEFVASLVADGVLRTELAKALDISWQSIDRMAEKTTEAS
jgi:hypothetical protein